MTLTEEETKVLGWPNGRPIPEKNGGVAARIALNDCAPETTITSGLSPYTGTFDKSHLIHLLKRVLCGVTVEDIQYYSNKPLTQVLNELLVTENTLTSQPLQDYKEGADAAGVAFGQPWGDKVLPGLAEQSPYDNATRAITAIHWNMGIALQMKRTVHEKLCLFWHNHFPTGSEAVNRGQRSYVYVKHIRENVNTPLHEMCKIITKDPAMLLYLNGEVNTKGSADENFARELQELFTIGKELPLGKRYTEVDVRAAARTLTGHGVRPFEGGNYNAWHANYSFTSYDHDTTNKQFSEFYGNTVIQGGQDGERELDDLIAMIFDDTTPPTILNGTEWEGWTRADIIADHLVKKIYRWFVSPHIDEHVKTNIIKPLANTYKANDFKILPVLKQLFASEHFFDEGLRGVCIKMPMDVVVGLLRVFAINPDRGSVALNAAMNREMFSRVNGMGQGYFAPPNIAGWQAYYQSPQYHLLWINADSLPKRQDFAKSLVGNGIQIFHFTPFTFATITADVLAFAKKLTSPEDPNKLILELNELLLGIPCSQAHRDKLKKDHLLTGQSADYYWTDAWLDATETGASANSKRIVETRLKSLLDYLVRLEEFQLT